MLARKGPCFETAAGFRVQGSGFRVQGSGFRVQGAGFRVQGTTDARRKGVSGTEPDRGGFLAQTLPSPVNSRASREALPGSRPGNVSPRADARNQRCDPTMRVVTGFQIGLTVRTQRWKIRRRRVSDGLQANLEIRATTLQKYAEVPRRARIRGLQIVVSLS